ncbi:hypothetical protein [Streptomyces sp. NPDC001137]|uniref:hypothetical protein n=1 Tax=Streptomyces sp. NPDC001137 TaxID=3154378 RepID=UPI00332E2D95
MNTELRDGLRTRMRVIAELGQRCPSTAWSVALSAALKRVCSPLFPQEVREVLCADPEVIVCGSTTPLRARAERTGYGFSISGRWRATAGCQESVWSVLAVPMQVKVRARGQLHLSCVALVSTRDLVVERTSPATGDTLVAQDVVVPPAHVVIPMSEADSAPGALAASTALLAMVVVTLAPLLGAAHAAQRATGTSLSGAGSATRRALHVADVLDALPDAHGQPACLPAQQQAQLWAELVSAEQECRAALEKLLDLHWAGGLAPDVPLRRFWRDVAVITRGPQFSPHTIAEDYGRVLFGPGAADLPWT